MASNNTLYYSLYLIQFWFDLIFYFVCLDTNLEFPFILFVSRQEFKIEYALYLKLLLQEYKSMFFFTLMAHFY